MPVRIVKDHDDIAHEKFHISKAFANACQCKRELLSEVVTSFAMRLKSDFSGAFFLEGDWENLQLHHLFVALGFAIRST